jgi:aryl-alcohol dehydrogenase-like predicted oxidoreductase
MRYGIPTAKRKVEMSLQSQFSPPSISMEIVLGTANLEQEYGKKGKASKLTRVEAAKILADFVSRGTGSIETSSGYGNAEKIIGEILCGESIDNVTTKIAPADYNSSKKIIESVSRSLENLGQTSLRSVMLHGGLNVALTNRESVEEGLNYLLEQKLVQNIGFSAYDDHEVLQIKEIFPRMTKFQMPENIADQRFINSKILGKMAKAGNSFQIRSIFLQGKLFLTEKEAKSQFPELLPVIQHIDKLCARFECERLDICLAYARVIPWAQELIVGVQTFNEYKSIIESLRSDQLEIEDYGAGLDGEIVDPRNWK